MSAVTILLVSAFVAIPLGLKYLFAFETRKLLAEYKERESDVLAMSAELRALKQESRVTRRALHQIEGQRRKAHARRTVAERRLTQWRSAGDLGPVAPVPASPVYPANQAESVRDATLVAA